MGTDISGEKCSVHKQSYLEGSVMLRSETRDKPYYCLEIIHLSFHTLTSDLGIMEQGLAMKPDFGINKLIKTI